MHVHYGNKLRIIGGSLTVGYTIPKGWALMVVPAALQLNPSTYEDPLTFNPWRWQVGWFLFCFFSQVKILIYTHHGVISFGENP